jgi:hypothetical protein
MTYSSFWFGKETDLGPGPYQVGNSLRFVGTNSYLTRTPSVTSGNTLYTYSCWVKNSCVGGDFTMIAGNKNFDGTGTRKSEQWGFQGFPGTNEGKLYWADGDNGSGGFVSYRSQGAFVDPCAWYHVVFQLDSRNGPDDTKVRTWINGVEQTLSPDIQQNPPASSINSINEANAVNVIGASYQKATIAPQLFR